MRHGAVHHRTDYKGRKEKVKKLVQCSMTAVASLPPSLAHDETANVVASAW